jgi:pSer/pThr/pTyr-binding forkhead associated (FHA) protein
MPDRASNPSQAGPSSISGLALRFISGKYQGGEFPLHEGQEIVIGRSSDLDMVLVEEMVSRKHSRIEMKNGIITIEDLGSTNGTFVNGEKIQRAKLREGDRVLIGTSILKLVAATPGAEGRRGPESSPMRRPGRPRATNEAPRMTGNLEEIPLPDLLQLFSTSRKSGVLVIRSDTRVGRIWLKDGVLHYAEIESQPELKPLKAVYRLLAWPSGFFELDPPETRRFDHPLDTTAQEVLMEGFRQQDELNEIRDKLPSPQARMILRTPLEAPLHELEPLHLDVLQIALNSPSVEVLFDRSPTTDLDTGKILISLMKRGYLTPA